MAKILAWFLSLLMIFTELGTVTEEGGFAVWRALLGGIPLSDTAVKDDFLTALDDGDVAHLSQNSGYYKNILAVCLRDGMTPLQKYRLFRQHHMTLLGWYCPANLYVLACGETSLTGLMQAAETLAQNDAVAYAGPVATAKTADAYTPNDPFDTPHNWSEDMPSGSNWWLEAVDAREAWDYTTGCADITVGILDSGFNTEHEELAGKLTFPAAKYARQNRAGSHGTHVAGMLAAQHDNGVGLAGLCPGASFKVVDWSPDTGQLWNGNLKILFGFCDLVKAGARVINCSFGSSAGVVGQKGSSMGMALDAALFSAVFSSLLNKGYDFVVVQSAGNGNSNNEAVDAYYNGTFCPITADNAITFGKTKPEDVVNRIIVVGAAAIAEHASYMQPAYSNVGKQVSVAAPGTAIYSCDTENGTYCYKSGTSMAAPVVTGVAALVWSAAPGLKGDAVKRIVCDEANTDAVAAPFDAYAFGNLDTRDYPLVNAAGSVRAALGQTAAGENKA